MKTKLQEAFSLDFLLNVVSQAVRPRKFFSTFFGLSIIFTDSRRDFNSHLCGKKWSHCSSVLAPALVAQQPSNSHNPSFVTFSHKGGLSMYSFIQSLLLLLPSVAAATPEVGVLVMFQLGSFFNDNFCLLLQQYNIDCNSYNSIT